jgi:hypothetical protein
VDDDLRDVRLDTRGVPTPPWWDEHVMTFDAELNALETPAGDSDGAIVSALSARNSNDAVTIITEVSPICVDVKHIQSSSTGRRTKMQIVAPNHLSE